MCFLSCFLNAFETKKKSLKPLFTKFATQIEVIWMEKVCLWLIISKQSSICWRGLLTFGFLLCLLVGAGKSVKVLQCHQKVWIETKNLTDMTSSTLWQINGNLWEAALPQSGGKRRLITTYTVYWHDMLPENESSSSTNVGPRFIHCFVYSEGELHAPWCLQTVAWQRFVSLWAFLDAFSHVCILTNDLDKLLSLSRIQSLWMGCGYLCRALGVH